MWLSSRLSQKLLNSVSILFGSSDLPLRLLQPPPVCSLPAPQLPKRAVASQNLIRAKSNIRLARDRDLGDALGIVI